MRFNLIPPHVANQVKIEIGVQLLDLISYAWYFVLFWSIEQPTVALDHIFLCFVEILRCTWFLSLIVVHKFSNKTQNRAHRSLQHRKLVIL